MHRRLVSHISFLCPWEASSEGSLYQLHYYSMTKYCTVNRLAVIRSPLFDGSCDIFQEKFFFFFFSIFIHVRGIDNCIDRQSLNTIIITAIIRSQMDYIFILFVLFQLSVPHIQLFHVSCYILCNIEYTGPKNLTAPRLNLSLVTHLLLIHVKAFLFRTYNPKQSFCICNHLETDNVVRLMNFFPFWNPFLNINVSHRPTCQEV